MRTRLGPAIVVLVAMAAIAALWLTRADEVGQALERIPAWALAAAVALHVATLVARTEAWRVTLAAAHAGALSRRVVHGANAAGFLAGCLQSQAALPARVAALRRLAGSRAPRPGVIFVADVPIFTLELCATALLLASALVAAGRAWWTAPVAVALAIAVLAAVRLAPRRISRPSIARGLAVFASHRRRRALAAFVATLVALTLCRVWLVLAVCGLPHGYTEVVGVFAALGVFGLLPIGPGAAPGATVAALGTAALAASVAAGLMLGASSILAVLVYALVVALSRALRCRRRLRPTPVAAGS